MSWNWVIIIKNPAYEGNDGKYLKVEIKVTGSASSEDL
jgi:hypothetical protein